VLPIRNTTMSSPSAPSGPSPTIDPALLISNEQRDDSLQGVFIGCFLNGIFTVVVGLAIYASVSKKGQWSSLLQPMMFFMLAMYGMATIGLAIHWDEARLGFMNNIQTQDAIYSSLSPPVAGLGIVLSYINMAVADGVLAWRCWAIWNRNWKVVVLPIILTMTELATGLVYTIVFMSHDAQVFVPNLELLLGVMDLINSFASLASTLLTTGLITYRILRANGSKFRAIMEIVIESAALYSIVLIFYIAFSLSPESTAIIPDVILSQITGLAPTLMVARITFGLARPTDSHISWNGTFSTLRFGSRAHARSISDQDTLTNEVFNLRQVESNRSRRHIDEGY